MYAIHLYGWDYTVWVDSDRKLTHIECYKRYPKTDVKYIWDDWLIGQLQERVYSLFDD